MGGVGLEELRVCVVLGPGSEELVEAIPPSVQFLRAAPCRAASGQGAGWELALLSPAAPLCSAGLLGSVFFGGDPDTPSTANKFLNISGKVTYLN